MSDYTVQVDMGDGSEMTIPNRWADPHIEWSLRYANDLNHPGAGRFSAASVLATFDYLLSKHITMNEATRRLRLMRAARAQTRADPGATS